MMNRKEIDSDTMKEMLKAAEGMGVAKGRQNFKSGEIIELQPVIHFSTFFGEWGWQGPHLIVHLFPRAGAADTWYEGRYVDNGRRYVPARKEIRPKGLSFPKNMEDIVKAAAEQITFGDVELDYVRELDSWALRFREAQPKEDWIKADGLLTKFFIAVDAGIEAR